MLLTAVFRGIDEDAMAEFASPTARDLPAVPIIAAVFARFGADLAATFGLTFMLCPSP